MLRVEYCSSLFGTVSFCKLEKKFLSKLLTAY